jgi:hypothetical protein
VLEGGGGRRGVVWLGGVSGGFIVGGVCVGSVVVVVVMAGCVIGMKRLGAVVSGLVGGVIGVVGLERGGMKIEKKFVGRKFTHLREAEAYNWHFLPLLLCYNHSSSVDDDNVDNNNNDDDNDNNNESKEGSEEDQDSHKEVCRILKRTLSQLKNNNPLLVELDVQCKSATKELVTFIALHLPNSTHVCKLHLPCGGGPNHLLVLRHFFHCRF